MPSETLPEQLHQRPSTGTEVTRRETSSAPIPYRGDNEAQLTINDILIPRLKFGQHMSKVVDDELVEYGSIRVELSKEDMSPVVLAKAPKKGELGPPVRFYIHAEPTKGWSYTDPAGDLQRVRPLANGEVPYPSLALVKNQNPANVNRTYLYVLTLPDYPRLPVTFLMYGAWGGQAAMQLNTDLTLLRLDDKPIWEQPFQVQVQKATKTLKGGNDVGFSRAIVGQAKVTAAQLHKDLELVERHRKLVGSAATIRTLEDEDVQTVDGEAVEAPPLD